MGQAEKSRQAKDGERVGIFGASGAGKTTKARQLLGYARRAVVFDSVKAEWCRNAGAWLGRRDCKIVSSVPAFKKALYSNFQKQSFAIIFRPEFGLEQAQFHEVAGLVFHVQAEYGIKHAAKIALFLEEAQEALPSGIAKYQPRNYGLIIAKMGRSRGIDFIAASQRIRTVDIGLRANLSYYYIFRLAELSDIKEAAELLHDKKLVMELPNYAYYRIAPDGRKTRGTV